MLWMCRPSCRTRPSPNKGSFEGISFILGTTMVASVLLAAAAARRSGNWGRLRQTTGRLVLFGVRRQGYSTYETRAETGCLSGECRFYGGRDYEALPRGRKEP
jgi:hypothetical protein